MRVLWITGTRSSSNKNGSYGGGGWIRSLREAVIQNTDIVLAQAFLYDLPSNPWTENGVTQFPLFSKQRSKLGKLWHNWIGYKSVSFDKDVHEMTKVISVFKPDVIHVFGIETSFAAIQEYTDIPVLIYIQGLLNPILNAYYPPGINKWSFLLHGCFKNEWITHNGFVFKNSIMKLNAKRELLFFSNAKYIIGRTDWDYQITKLLAPKAKYFILNEMMRPEFYTSNIWNKKREGRFIIYSTISNVTYKGLDLILKTAKILKEHGDIDFEWHIAGIDKTSKLIRFFEKEYSLEKINLSILFKGVVSSEQLVSDLLTSDVFVHTSYIDNSPNSICEAQLLGLPVISCYVGGVISLIKNTETGVLIPANDPHYLAYILKAAAKNDTHRKYSIPSRIEALKRHNREAILINLLNIYKQVQKSN